MNNAEWSKIILEKTDPTFKHRWVVFDELLLRSITKDKVWVDCGAGKNVTVSRFAEYAEIAVGVDLVNPEFQGNYIKANIKRLPFDDLSVDLITLRFVVEHFDENTDYFNELSRILKPGGKIIVLTTNLLSPFIFLPKIILPPYVKSRLLMKVFKVNDEDVFPTFHLYNTIKSYRNLKNKLNLISYQYISDINYTRKWMFLILLGWHILTKPKFLNKFRTNFLLILKKI